MRPLLLLHIAAAPLLLAGFSSAAVAQNSGVDSLIVNTCEVPPDNFDGNCPPTVATALAPLAGSLAQDQFNLTLGNAAAALSERGQQAAANNDIPLCIDIAQGIVRLADFAVDPVQRDAILQLAFLTCCVPVEFQSYGVSLAAAAEVQVTGTKQDGAIVADSASFQSASANFVADGVRSGDLLIIKSGPNQGIYQISSVQDQNTILVGGESVGGWPGSGSGIEFEIRRAGDLTQIACDIGFRTAAITPDESDRGSPN